MHRSVKPVTWTKWVFVQQISHKRTAKRTRASRVEVRAAKGRGKGGATVAALRIMLEILRDYIDRTDFGPIVEDILSDVCIFERVTRERNGEI